MTARYDGSHRLTLHQGLRYFQFDPEVAQAGMGAPLFNFKGEVIGILQGRLALPGQEEISVGLPIQTVRAVMEDNWFISKRSEREKFYKYIYDDLGCRV
jgi:S1-C subfamily serine protease